MAAKLMPNPKMYKKEHLCYNIKKYYTINLPSPFIHYTSLLKTITVIGIINK